MITKAGLLIRQGEDKVTLGITLSFIEDVGGFTDNSNIYRGMQVILQITLTYIEKRR
jgi:hypothetical protein